MAEPIETPAIVMMSEEDFVARLEVHFEELRKTLAEDVAVLDKAQTKTLMQTVIHDIWFQNVEKEEDQTALKT